MLMTPKTRQVKHLLKARTEVFEEFVELVSDGETREDGVINQGRPQVGQGAGGVESGILDTMSA